MDIVSLTKNSIIKNIKNNKKVVLSITCSVILLIGILIWYFAFHNTTNRTLVAEINGEKLKVDNLIPYIKYSMATSSPLHSSATNKNSEIISNALKNAIDAVVQNQNAKDYKIKLSSDDIKKIEQDAANNTFLMPNENSTKKFFQSLLISEKLKEKVLDEKAKKLSENDLKNFYEKYKNKLYFEYPQFNIQQIYISTTDNKNNPLPQEEVEKIKLKATEIYNLISNGSSFESLAKQYSDDITTKNNGGNTGYGEKHQFYPAIQENLDTLNVGQIIITQDSYGYYIFKILNKKDYRVKPFDEVKTEIAHDLIEAQPSNSYDSTLREWVESSKIVKYNDVINSIDLKKIK